MYRIISIVDIKAGYQACSARALRSQCSTTFNLTCFLLRQFAAILMVCAWQHAIENCPDSLSAPWPAAAKTAHGGLGGSCGNFVACKCVRIRPKLLTGLRFRATGLMHVLLSLTPTPTCWLFASTFATSIKDSTTQTYSGFTTWLGIRKDFVRSEHQLRSRQPCSKQVCSSRSSAKLTRP